MTIVRKNDSGQVALIMVLIMTVISAVAVSLAGRSTVETRIQQMEIDSNQALLTAQAGLEQAISKTSAVNGSLDSTKLYQVTVDTTGASSIASEKINKGSTVEINLTGASSITGAKIYWKSAIVGGKPAIYVSDVRSDRTVDYAYDTEGTGGFTKVSSGGTLNGINYPYVTPVTVPLSPGNSTVLSITVLGDAAFIGVLPIGGTFPAQSLKYKSVASVGTGSDAIKYGLEYNESIVNQLPEIYDYALFSGGTIIQ